MKILFIMRHAMYVRNFESVIAELCRRGHSVRLGFTSSREGVHDAQPKRLAQELSGFSYEYYPSRGDAWRVFATGVRNLLDYLRYLHPRYANAQKLRERAATRIPTPVRSILSWPLVRRAVESGLLGRSLHAMENAIPADRAITGILRAELPDIVLVTPLVDLGSNEIDYLKAARIMRLPTGLCVASWDNLTNKGIIQIEPDSVFVWNEAMQTEAVELHGMSPDRVEVTGAPIFDHWFVQTHRYGRSDFCDRLGLDPRVPYIVYLCSSTFIASEETRFVKNWIGAVRASGKSPLAQVGIVIRPHPANARQWMEADFKDLSNLVIWPRAGSHPIDDSTKADYFDTIYHSAAVMGINTSAFIESGIMGRPCLTILSPEFAHTQGGTLHFRHIAEGGLLYVASGIAEHLGQLDGILNGHDPDREKRSRFLKDFLRPQGLDSSSTPIYVEAILKLTRMERSDPKHAFPAPLRQAFRLLLFPVALSLLAFQKPNPRS
ncbi:MAG TPA: hypothetical protein VJ385_11835 [Fibrobacteria bacterium]|nr:hypothetical protein [Fibrobacteria bacterium]